MRSIFLQFIAICSIRALENPIPSSYLQPRNFNPHPYQEDSSFLISTGHADDFQERSHQQKYEALARNFHNTGPIQFPVSPPNPQRQQQQLEQKRRIISHIVDKQALIPHPYARLALNYRAQQLTRFNGKDDQLPLIYQALTSHGRRVQNNDFQQKNFIARAKHHHNRIDEDYQEEADPIRSSSSNHEKKQYRFSYAVKDRISGDDFSHTQKQENGAVHGSYKVQLPDGRTQIVKYTADDVHGYRAVVTYEGETQAHQAHTQPTPIRHQQRVYYPQVVNQVEINNIRHTVTPTPYSSAEYNIRAPSAIKYYPSTTALPRHYY